MSIQDCARPQAQRYVDASKSRGASSRSSPVRVGRHDDAGHVGCRHRGTAVPRQRRRAGAPRRRRRDRGRGVPREAGGALGEAMKNDGTRTRRCGLCGKILRPNDSISVAEVGERCYRCFNEELADRLGIDFDNTPIAPIVVTDVDGVRHRFEIRSMLVGTGHAMYAREVRNRDAEGGYRFADPRRSRGRRPGLAQALARANPPGAQRSTRPADRARVAAHAGAPAQWRHRVGPRDRRCAPAVSSSMADRSPGIRSAAC